MSVPSTNIHCSQCGASGSTLDLNGHFFYQNADGLEVSVERKLGYCHQCATLAPLENLNLADAEARAQECKDHLGTAIAELERETGRWVYILGLWERGVAEARSSLAHWENALACAEWHCKLCQQPDRTPKCLECGSSDVAPLSIPPLAQLRTEGPANLPCPAIGCTGTLTVAESRLRFRMRSKPPRYFDQEGYELDELEDVD
jgi:hypothetical protein